jgi:hypothetical protein
LYVLSCLFGFGISGLRKIIFTNMHFADVELENDYEHGRKSWSNLPNARKSVR